MTQEDIDANTNIATASGTTNLGVTVTSNESPLTLPLCLQVALLVWLKQRMRFALRSLGRQLIIII